MDKIISIKYALQTLRIDSIRSPNSEEGARKLMNRHKMLFLEKN